MENIRKEELWLANGEKKIYGEIYLPEEKKDRYPTVILSHGFGGNHGTVPALYAPAFAKAGFAAYTYDFCGGGPESKSSGTMVEMSVLTEASDLSAVVDGIKALPYVDSDNLFLWGESMGGFVSTCVAARRPEEFKAILLMFPAYVLQDDAKKRNPDPASIPETEDVMGLTLGAVFTKDAISFDIYEEIPKYTGDVLLLHGDQDALVPLACSERAAKLFPSVTFTVMEGGTHGFVEEVLDKSVELCADFLKNHTDN